MKKLLLISIVLVVVGLGLILYSDPIVTLASGGGSHLITTQITNPNAGGPPSGSGTGGNGGFFVNSTVPNGAGGPATMEYITIAGVALCGVGIFVTAIEAVSKSSGVPQTKTVT